nr:P700 chlorophyll a-apoprotein A2, chloroplastic [Tanacetum cinerariifolium]
ESGSCLSPSVADHPLGPTTDHCLGKLLPHQLANQTRTPPREDSLFCSSTYEAPTYRLRSKIRNPLEEGFASDLLVDETPTGGSSGEFFTMGERLTEQCRVERIQALSRMIGRKASVGRFLSPPSNPRAQLWTGGGNYQAGGFDPYLDNSSNWWVRHIHGLTTRQLLRNTHWGGAKNGMTFNAGPRDFLVHHAIALGLHTTTLILVKGALDARGSKLMPDKKDFGYSFSCDGPGRGESEEDLLFNHPEHEGAALDVRSAAKERRKRPYSFLPCSDDALLAREATHRKKKRISLLL